MGRATSTVYPPPASPPHPSLPAPARPPPASQIRDRPLHIASLGLNVLEGSVRSRPSREGKYVSVTVSFTCPDREKYDAAHEVLRADPDIRWTL